MTANTDEASLASPPLTFCCAAQFQTGHRPVPVQGPGVGDSCARELGWVGEEREFIKMLPRLLILQGVCKNVTVGH